MQVPYAANTPVCPDVGSRRDLAGGGLFIRGQAACGMILSMFIELTFEPVVPSSVSVNGDAGGTSPVLMRSSQALQLHEVNIRDDAGARKYALTNAAMQAMISLCAV
jgi:hypothetical protein